MSLLSFLDIDLETANKFYSWGWKASLVGALITLFGVTLLMWGTRVRDHDFESHITNLNSESTNSRERTAILEKGNIELQTKLEQERTARLTLEAKLAPRRLSESDKKLLIAALKPFKGQKCIISYALANTESDIYANDFVNVLDSAGWDHNGKNGIQGSIWSNPLVGIQITVQRGPDSTAGMVTPGIGVLIKTMRKLGLTGGPYEFYTDPAIPTGMVDIRIGTK